MRLMGRAARRLLPCVLVVIAAPAAQGQTAFPSSVPTFAPAGPNGTPLPQPALPPTDPLPQPGPAEMESPPVLSAAGDEGVSPRPVEVLPVFDGLETAPSLSDEVVVPTVLPTDEAGIAVIQTLLDDEPSVILPTTTASPDRDRQGGVTESPEPGSLTLCGLGLCGLLGYAWRRRRG
jgi:hypothetical protein